MEASNRWRRARTRRSLALVVLFLALLALLPFATRAHAAAGVPASVAVSLSPSSIPADGASHSTATATVTDSNGLPVPNTSVTFGTSGDVTFSSSSAMTDVTGKATSTITASKTADVETISATAGGHTGTAQLTEFGGAGSLALVLTPSTIVANGTATSTATATVKDANNNPVTNATVTFSKGPGGDVTFSPNPGTNHNDGTYTTTITASKTADVETITASTANNVSDQKFLTETPGPVSSVSLVLDKSQLTANGTDSTLATATVTDANGNPEKGETISFGTNGDVTFSPNPGTNHNDGTYTTTITASTTADQETISAQDTAAGKSGTAKLTEVAGSASTVTIALTPSHVPANGTSTSQAVATLKDGQGNPVTIDTVNFSASDTGVTFSPNPATNNHDGTYSTTVTSSTRPGNVLISASAASANVSGTATLTQFGPSTAIALSLTPSSIPADGASHSTAKATLTDKDGNGVANASVAFGTSGDVTFSNPTNNGDGTYTSQITSSLTADTETITASGDGHSKTAQLTETTPATSTTTSTTTTTTSSSTTSTTGSSTTSSSTTSTTMPNSGPRTVNTAGLVGDDWGGLHGYSEGSTQVPTYSGGPYWPGQDVARGVSAVPGGGGVEVDDWGGLHPFTINGNGPPGAPSGGPYWPGQDVVRGVAVTSDGKGGFEVDDWGGLHPFALGAGPAPAAANNVAFWPGQDVARGVVILADGTGGFTIDDWGGLHPFGIGSHAPPPKPTGGPYWPGQDAARGITILADGSGGYIGDSWGGLHGIDLSGKTIPASPTNGPYWPGMNVGWGPATTGGS